MKSVWLNICVLIIIQQTMYSVAFQREPRSPHGPHGPHGLMANKCCNTEPTPEEVTHQETVKKFMEECDQELGKPEPGKHKERFLCIAECISKKVKILNEDGTFNEEAAKEYVTNEIAKQDYLKPIAADTATKCIEATKEPSGENPSGCSKLPMKFMGCIMKDFFEACPADLQDKSEHCVKIREKLSSGQFGPPEE